MKFSSRKEQRHVIERFTAFILPMMQYLNDDMQMCITKILRILNEVEVESND